jgi:O-antigen/teichoic acid export membrane protein
LKNASYLTLGNIVSQIISFIGFLFIARILGPENYGIYVTVVAYVGIFLILTLYGMNMLIVREGSKNLVEMDKYLEKVIGLKNLFVLIAIIVCISALFITNYDLQTKIFIVIFSSTLFLSSTKEFLDNIFQAHERMEYISIFTVANRLLFTGSAILVLYLDYGIPALLLLQIFYSAMFLIFEYRVTKKFVIFKFWKKIKWDKSIFKPAMVFSALTFFGILTTRIDLVMISLLGTSKDVGIYGVAYNIVLQGEMLRNIVLIAFFPILVKMFNSGSIRSRTLFRYSVIMGIGIFILAILGYFYSEPVVTLLFGERYSESGSILRILVFYIAIIFFMLPFAGACLATGNENLALMIAPVSAGMNIILNYILFLNFGLIGIAYSTIIVFSFSTIISIGLYYNRMKRQGFLV